MLGVDCVVGTVSRIQKPTKNKRVRNDKADAETLTRLLATHNITEVFVPVDEVKALRNITRACEDACNNLRRAKPRLTKFPLAYGCVFDERNDNGIRKGNWTRTHLE